MKRYMLILAAALAVACGPATKDIRISFEVENPVEKSVVLVYNGNINEVALSETGHGEAVLSDMDLVYANVFYGMNAKKVYFEAGDEAKISFRGNDFMGTFRFEGAKAPAVAYLNSVTLTSLPDEDFALPFDEYKAKVAAKEADALKLLSATDLKGTGDFRKVEEGRTEYSYMSSIMMYPVGHQLMTQDMTYVPSESYYDEIRKYAVEDEMLVNVQEYRDFMAEAASILGGGGEQGFYNRIVAKMRYIADNYKNVKVRELMLHHLAAPYIENMGTDGVQDMENIYRTYVRNPVLLADFQAKYDKWDLTIPGKPSPEFSAPDIDGKKWSLRDFRGKYVYIDIWATWCAPCRAELPYLAKLEKSFEGRNIVFLGLSIDEDKAAWENKVRSGELSGVQLYLGTGSSFQNRYRINGIPRFILIDREGKVLNANMTRPSSDDTARILNELEGI